MQKELLKDIRNNRKKYQKLILDAIENEVYECERYKINLSIALGDTDSSSDVKELAKTLRETDKLIILDEHICCVVFPFTDIAQGIKAASNLLSKFEMENFSQKIYMGVVTIEDCDRPQVQVVKLFDILEYAIENGINNIPLDTISL